MQITHTDKFEELKVLYNVDENFDITINSNNNQIVYTICDEIGNYILIDFDTNNKTFGIVFNPVGEKIFSNPREKY